MGKCELGGEKKEENKQEIRRVANKTIPFVQLNQVQF